MARTDSSRPGRAKASWVAEASPLSNSTHQLIQAKTATSGRTTAGWKRAANGAVSRRVFSSSVTATLKRRPSSGLLRGRSGWEPSSLATSPVGRSFSTSSRALSAETGLPIACAISSAISSYVRCPSSADRVAYRSGVSCTVWPSARRARAGGVR